MPVWGWIVIAVVVVLAALAIVAGGSVSRRKRTERLRERFGPEYERTVDEVGEQKAAENELATRERNRQKLEIVALDPDARDRYSHEWRAVQTAFVDNPAAAVVDADRLVNDVMRERGYPVDDFDKRAADISVDHPQIVENYRSAHDIFLLQEAGEVGTEHQRTAFVHYRALFERLLETDQGTESPKEART